ncbi:MAG: hypothetical protein ABSE93_09050 [Terriglobia bacterium]|jgi:hypothetical protein
MPVALALLIFGLLAPGFFADGQMLAACHVITPSGNGSASGADWNNACAGMTGNCLPSGTTGMVRGDTYYFATGTYPPFAASVADSGSLYIYLTNATVGDHCTGTGWNSGLAGRVTFQDTPSMMIQFNSDYWDLSGHSRATPTSGHGILIDNCTMVSGSCTSTNIQTALYIGDSGTSLYTNIHYVEISGSHSAAGTPCDIGVWGWSAGNNLYEYNYIHDTGAPMFQTDNANQTFQYNWTENNGNNVDTCHGNHLIWRGDNAVIRYNVFHNCQGTTCIDNAGTSGSTNVSIYGNVFFRSNPPFANGVESAILLNHDGNILGNILVYNNTFSGFGVGDAEGYDRPGLLVDGTAQSIGNVYFQNNYFDSNSDGVAYFLPCTNCASATWDHNTYYAGAAAGDTDPNKQVLSSSLLVNYLSDWHLIGDSGAGVTFASPYNTDPDGIVRGVDGVWDRGAYQLNKVAAPYMNPPSAH